MLVAKIMNYGWMEESSILHYTRSVVQVTMCVFAAMETLNLEGKSILLNIVKILLIVSHLCIISAVVPSVFPRATP